MTDWQRIIREVTKEAASAKWRDYALARLPEVPGWRLTKPRGFGGGTEAIYEGRTKAGVPLRVTVDKANGVWRAEAGGMSVEDDISGLDAGAVGHALGEATEAMDQRIKGRAAARDFSSADVRRLSGSLHDIRERAATVLSSLGAMQEEGTDATLEEVRRTVAADGANISYHLDMIEQAAGAFRRP